MSLACGLQIGDRVMCSNGEAATIVGPPARSSCRGFSVCVQYASTGAMKDERASTLVLQAGDMTVKKPVMCKDEPVELISPRLQHQPEQHQLEQPALPSFFLQTGSFAEVRQGKPRMKPNDKQVCVRITHLLNHRDVLKAEVCRCFDEIDVKRHGALGIQGLMELCRKVETFTLVPSSAFGNFPDTYSRFDFNGDGSLDKNEAYKCIKYCLKAHRKALDGHPVPDVPYVSGGPAQKGYRTIKVLASGGQGTASLAQNRQGEELVLKSYNKSNANAGGIDEIRDELEVMQAMGKCPFIASCLEIFQDDNNFYMVSAMNRGGDFESLGQRATQEGVAVTEDWYKSLFGQIFVGLEHMHRNAMMHCDIKEKNLMVRNGDLAHPEAVIIDLGLAHALFDKGGVFGTPGYIPPETWATAKWFPKGDVFSMGVVCFQMLTGQTDLFVRGAKTIEDVSFFTQNRQPRYGQVGNNPLIREWLPKTLEKRREHRLKSKQVLEARWFAEPEMWLPNLHPLNRLCDEPCIADAEREDVENLAERRVDFLDYEKTQRLNIDEGMVRTDNGVAPAASLKASRREAPQPVAQKMVARQLSVYRLAGGLCPGDLVAHSRSGRLAKVIGPPSRAGCMAISVAVQYIDDGGIVDERANILELQSE